MKTGQQHQSHLLSGLRCTQYKGEWYHQNGHVAAPSWRWEHGGLLGKLPSSCLGNTVCSKGTPDNPEGILSGEKTWNSILWHRILYPPLLPWVACIFLASPVWGVCVSNRGSTLSACLGSPSWDRVPAVRILSWQHHNLPLMLWTIQGCLCNVLPLCVKAPSQYFSSAKFPLRNQSSISLCRWLSSELQPIWQGLVCSDWLCCKVSILCSIVGKWVGGICFFSCFFLAHCSQWVYCYLCLPCNLHSIFLALGYSMSVVWRELGHGVHCSLLIPTMFLPCHASVSFQFTLA